MLSPLHHTDSLKGRSVFGPVPLHALYFLMQMKAPSLSFSAHHSGRNNCSDVNPSAVGSHDAGWLTASEDLGGDWEMQGFHIAAVAGAGGP